MNNTAQPSTTTGYDSNYKRFADEQRPLLPSLKEMTDQPMYNAPMYGHQQQQQQRPPQQQQPYQQQQQYNRSPTTPNAPPPQYYQPTTQVAHPPQLYSPPAQQQQQQVPPQQQVKTTPNKLANTVAPPPSSTTVTTTTTTATTTKRNKKEAQRYSDTIFSEYTEHSDNCLDPETIRFYTRNATFIEYNNGKLLLSSVKHGVTLELPNMEEFDEMNSRIRLVDALTNREVFCSTSSSLRSKGQRVVYGQTLSLFDQCSNDAMSTELEFRFRESTTTNKRPYVLRIEVYKHNELICSFQTEPFNVVWRDPAKTSRKARGSNQTPVVASPGPNVENPRPKKRKLDSGNVSPPQQQQPQPETKSHNPVFEYQQPQQQQQQPQYYGQQQYPPMYQPKQEYYAHPPQQQQQQNAAFNGNYPSQQGYPPQQSYYH